MLLSRNLLLLVLARKMPSGVLADDSRSQCLPTPNSASRCPEIMQSLDPLIDCQCYHFCSNVFKECSTAMTVPYFDCDADDEIVSGCVSEDRYLFSSYSEEPVINVDPIDTEIYPYPEIKPVYVGNMTSETNEDDPFNTGIVPVYYPPSDAPAESNATSNTTSTTEINVDLTDTENNESEIFTSIVVEPEKNVNSTETNSTDTNNTSNIGGTTHGISSTEGANETGTTNTSERPHADSMDGNTTTITSGTVCTRNSDGSFNCSVQATSVSPPSTASQGGSSNIRGSTSNKPKNTEERASKTTKLKTQGEDVSSAANRVVCTAKGISALLVGMLYVV